MSEHAHGGDLERIAREAGVPVGRLLDFSANVNPAGLPRRAAERLAREAADPGIIARYPDPACSELRAVLSERVGVAPETIAISAGADALIHAAVRALAPKRCVVPQPAFCEYKRVARAFGCAVCAWPVELERGDLLVLNNPHNPTGACAPRAEMLARIESARAAGAMVLADEAFVDYVPEAAITSDAVERAGVVSIRSLTKFYGCPGLRVGYAVAAAETARAIAAQVQAWPVTTLAMNALAEALRDEEYARRTIEENGRARKELVAGLEALGIEVAPAAANFLLLRLESAGAVRRALLAEHAMVVRECDSFAGLERDRYLRVAVRTAGENARLVAALARVFEGVSCQQNR